MKKKNEENRNGVTGNQGGITRRQMLKGTVTAGILASTGAMALNLTKGDANAAESRVIPTKWDETLDTVVVGSGFAGLAAAA